ncbi:CTLH/CRA C-terminal to lish motif domain-containing protein [Geopyxis carbonaria]|nr:CTLH/CRA C-terminal to lish motif domain-containing protein [Geopyxis carbonaria]
MNVLQVEFDRLNNKANLSKAITDIDKCLALLEAARNQIAEDPKSQAMTLARLQQSMNTQLERVGSDHKEIYSALTRYGKSLDRKFKAASAYSSNDYDALSNQGHLINRTAAMHLIREGQFSVASTFLEEAGNIDIPEGLQADFMHMYQILDAMNKRQDLGPAILWARQNAPALEKRGSNLEFDLCKLQFVSQFLSGIEGRDNAMKYLRTEAPRFQQKHSKEVQRLMCAFLYVDTLFQSPYGKPFMNPEKAWVDVANSFTNEFCSLLNLSAESPLYIAATAGAIALPTLLKMTSIMKEKKTEWNSQNELPAEIPLPPAYHFHSIFVCPVSKDQTTEDNPPMMLPCGHVIAQESLQRLTKGGSSVTLKCPYCPKESSSHLAVQVII